MARAFEEGSGQAVDGDQFDATYLHLFVWDADARAIVGGYRLGETDRLLLSYNLEMETTPYSRLYCGFLTRKRPIPHRHYHKLGAQFVSAAVDSSFNNTPGLLLCLNVPSIPDRYLRQYIGEGMSAYLNYQAN